MLSEHFSLAELTFTQIRGLDNTPPADLEARLRLILAPGLEKVRTILGQPMHINSGYRSPAVNKAVGGSKTSAHVQGYAADFICPAFGAPLEICQLLAKGGPRGLLRFDQLIYEHSWVHISFDALARGQVLTFNGHGYATGIHP